MDSSKSVRQNESHAGAIPAMTNEILARIDKISAQKRAGGPNALQGSVSFKFMDPPSANKPRGLFRRRNPKSNEVAEGSVAWRIGSLLKLPAASLFIDENSNGYIARSFLAPRRPGEVTLITKESLNSLTYVQVEEIRDLLRKSRG